MVHLMSICVKNFLERSLRLADAMGRTPSGMSHLLFNDGHTLPKMLGGDLGVAVKRVQRAETALGRYEREMMQRGRT